MENFLKSFKLDLHRRFVIVIFDMDHVFAVLCRHQTQTVFLVIVIPKPTLFVLDELWLKVDLAHLLHTLERLL
jgi:hypothetical protein